jgi:hypothetical protein
MSTPMPTTNSASTANVTTNADKTTKNFKKDKHWVKEAKPSRGESSSRESHDNPKRPTSDTTSKTDKEKKPMKTTFDIKFDKMKEKNTSNPDYQKLVDISCPFNLENSRIPDIAKIIADCETNISIFVPDPFVLMALKKLLDCQEKCSKAIVSNASK